MIVGVQDVYYNVLDMKRALSFYRDVLGFQVRYESDDWCTLDIGGLQFGLEDSGGRPIPRARGEAGAVLTLKTTDLRTEVERLRAKGVGFLGGIGDYDWGSVIGFEDSEGNYLKLMQPPP